MSKSRKSQNKKSAAAKDLVSNRAATLQVPHSNKLALFIIALILITLGIYASSLKNLWTNWDDEGYVLQNKLVTSFDLKSIFSEQVMGNYHPVTVLTEAIEFHFFHNNAAGFHSVSLLLHLLNVLLLFYFILRLTQKNIVAFLCALLFAIHPLHVESVSWVSAQKDLLYVLFYFLSLIFYLQYAEPGRKSAAAYLIVVTCFILSLLSKAQAVTFPIVILLIDWYQGRKLSVKSILEKTPFFILSLVFGIVAIYAQKASESIQDIALYSFPERLMFSAYAIVAYLTRLFLPINLSTYYPYPESIGNSFPVAVYTAPLIVIIIAFLVFRFRKKYPEVVFGMLFFLVNISLVLQLLPVGGAITADRYSYLSFTGFFFIAAIWLNDVWENKNVVIKNARIPLMAGVSGWLIFLAIQCQARTKVWYSSETLWKNVITNYPRVPIAYNDLGSYYQKHEQLDLAKKNFDVALKLQPDFTHALINRCDLFRVQNKIDSAIMDGNRAVKLKPGDPDTHMNRGIAFSIHRPTHQT